MSKIKNSVNDAMKIMRDRADASQASTDYETSRRKRIRIQNIATVGSYVAGVVLGAAAVVYVISDASKPMQFENED